MKVFCDTNIFIAAFLEGHEHHAVARPILDRVVSGVDRGYLAAHSLAEIYAVLTRLPAQAHIGPTLAWRLIEENILPHFALVALTAAEYRRTVQRVAGEEIEGGQMYDALILAAAAKSQAERIFTLNVHHFRQVAPPSLREKIVAPLD